MNNKLVENHQLSVLLLLGVVSVLGILPFIVIRYLQENYTAAGIDAALVVGIVVLVSYAILSKKTRIVSAILAVFINSGVVAIVLANGLDSFLWVYPVFASTFFLVRPFEALAINLVTGAVLVVCSDIFNTIQLDSFIVTIVMLSLSAFVYASRGEKQFRLLEKLNTVDALTGALNRRALATDMQKILAISERSGLPHLLVILDLDHFKAVNDQYGHAVGDQVLVKFVAIISANIRKYDQLYRFGGEEFILLVPEINDQQGFINNLRAVIKNQLKTPDGKEVTVSFGAAAWAPSITADSWLKSADDALYQAKKSGRDCVIFSDDNE